MNPITIKRNDSYDALLTITQDGTAVNITGWEFWFTIRLKSTVDTITSDTDDTDAIYSLNWTSHTDPTAGETLLEVPYTATNLDPRSDYYYDIQVKTSANKIYTLVVGDLFIIADSTRSTT